MHLGASSLAVCEQFQSTAATNRRRAGQAGGLGLLAVWVGGIGVQPKMPRHDSMLFLRMQTGNLADLPITVTPAP